MRKRQESRFPQLKRADLPIVLGNSMAKSGSHILSQFLMGLESLTPLVFANWVPIRTLDRDGHTRDPQQVITALGRLVPGDIGWGYLPADDAYLRWFHNSAIVSFFVYRDPRDKIVSHIMYALNIHRRHAMHDFYSQIETMEERIHHTIVGVPGLVEPVRKTYESYWSWLEEPGVMGLRYEDLIGAREETLNRMLDFLGRAEIPLNTDRDAARRILNEAMLPQHSPTFRSGSTNEWTEHFTRQNIKVFVEGTGDLMERLGYPSEWSAAKRGGDNA
jgi:hypothetical protein